MTRFTAILRVILTSSMPAQEAGAAITPKTARRSAAVNEGRPPQLRVDSNLVPAPVPVTDIQTAW